MDGIIALLAFPVVFVTVDKNIMLAGAFHFYSFNPPSVMAGIKPEKYTHGLIIDKKEFAINIPIREQHPFLRTLNSKAYTRNLLACKSSKKQAIN